MSEQCSVSTTLEKSLKTAMFRPNSTAEYQRYQPDISRISICTDMSCHPFSFLSVKLNITLERITRKFLLS